MLKVISVYQACLRREFCSKGKKTQPAMAFSCSTSTKSRMEFFRDVIFEWELYLFLPVAGLGDIPMLLFWISVLSTQFLIFCAAVTLLFIYTSFKHPSETLNPLYIFSMKEHWHHVKKRSSNFCHLSMFYALDCL